MAFADMDVISLIEAEKFLTRLEKEKHLSALVLDCNLTNKALRFLLRFAARRAVGLKIGIGVCGEKMKNLEGLLPFFNLLIINALEATALLDPSFKSISPIEKAKALCRLGVSAVIITLGKKGVVYADNSQAFYFKNVAALSISDSNGAGDAFSAGVIDGLLRKTTLKEALQEGCNRALLQLSVLGTEPLEEKL